MTQTGKCDICRQRKVKCDEAKPKCSACQKKNRPCTYSYGKPTAFVLQDPNQLTRHGRSKVKDIVFALGSCSSSYSPTTTTAAAASTTEPIAGLTSLEELRIITERPAGNGHGVFQTLIPPSKRGAGIAKKAAAYQRRRLREYLAQLQCEAALSTIKPACHGSTLTARYISILGSQSLDLSPLAILGTWIQTIPSRIGSSLIIDLAVEFLIDSHAVYLDGSYSNRNKVQSSKSMALKELQLIVSGTHGVVPYEAVLATKLHYAAEALAGIDTMYHAIHAFGLAELLKTGKVANVDDEHYWNLIDNTYIDDVNEAILAGRNSVFDNDFYLSSTYPPPLDLSSDLLSAQQRASMTLMHVFIQCPRLASLVRMAISDPNDTTVLASAVSLAEKLLQLDIPSHMESLLQSSITNVTNNEFLDIADFIPTFINFNTVQNMILCTRYWMLQNVLCGIVDTLHRHFPAETALSVLPDPNTNLQADVNAALELAKSLSWSESLSQHLPLVSLRLHTPLQISIGPWHRTVRNYRLFQTLNGAFSPNLPFIDPDSLLRAERMKDWVITQCNAIHVRWNVSTVSERPLLEALDTIAGEAIPAWLPVRVRFEAEDGEMVLKLDYQNQRGSYSERFDLESGPQMSEKQRSEVVFGACEAEAQEGDVIELPYHPASERAASLDVDQSRTKRPAESLRTTGRNLCSTSEWWPTSPSSSTVLLDSTHKAAAFSCLSPPMSSDLAPRGIDRDRHLCLASSWCPQGLNSLAESPRRSTLSSPSSTAGKAGTARDNVIKNACISPAWSSMQSFGSAGTPHSISVRNACISPAWSRVTADAASPSPSKED